MEDEPKETERRRREMSRIVWILLPIATFFFLLLLIEQFGLSQK